jgi:hypothetical protein
LIWFLIIHHYLQDDVEKVAINLLEYFAKYGYLLTRNRVQIFNHASIFGYKQTDIWLQTEIPRKTLSGCGVRRRSPEPRGSILRGPFLLPTHVTNGSAGGSFFGFVFAAVHGYPGKATAEIMVAG